MSRERDESQKVGETAPADDNIPRGLVEAVQEAVRRDTQTADNLREELNRLERLTERERTLRRLFRRLNADIATNRRMQELLTEQIRGQETEAATLKTELAEVLEQLAPYRRARRPHS